MKRLKCLWFVLRMPGCGLEETEMRLWEMRDFYRLDLSDRKGLFRVIHRNNQRDIKADYRVARGGLADTWDGEPAEVSIRRLRDGETPPPNPLPVNGEGESLCAEARDE